MDSHGGAIRPCRSQGHFRELRLTNNCNGPDRKLRPPRSCDGYVGLPTGLDRRLGHAHARDRRRAAEPVKHGPRDSSRVGSDVVGDSIFPLVVAFLFFGGLAVDRVFGSPVMRWLLKRGWLPSLGSKEDPLLGRVKKVHDALQSFAERAQVESLLASLDDVQNRQESRAHRIQAGEEVAAQLDTAKSELDAVKSELDAVTSEFSALGSELDALEPEVPSRSEESDRQTARYSSFEAIFLAAIGALTLFLYLLPTPWIAPQRIELADGMQFVGYVVSDEGATDTVVLTDVDRRVLMIPSNASV